MHCHRGDTDLRITILQVVFVPHFPADAVNGQYSNADLKFVFAEKKLIRQSVCSLHFIELKLLVFYVEIMGYSTDTTVP